MEFDVLSAATADALAPAEPMLCLAPTSGLLICAALVVLALVLLGDVLAPAKGPRR